MTAERKEPDIRIRKASREDDILVALVLALAFAEHEASYSSEAYATTVTSSDEIERRLSEGPVWIATRDKEVVGTGRSSVEVRRFTFAAWPSSPPREVKGLASYC